MTDQLAAVKHQPFDYQYLKGLLGAYRHPRNKIGKMLVKGEIIALKRGLYILNASFGRELVPEIVANLLYGPSYVSLEYALASYGFIPEAAFHVTSVTTGRRKIFATAVGTFTYRQLEPGYYSRAYRLRRTGDSGYLVATPEKALCDSLYLAPRLNDTYALEQYLFADLRVDPILLRDLDGRLISQLAGISRKNNHKLLQEIVQ